MLKFYVIIGILAVLSTCLSSIRFWYNLIVRKNIFEVNSYVDVKKVYSFKDFLRYQLIAIYLQCVIVPFALYYSKRICLFCGGILVGIIITFIAQLLYCELLNDGERRQKSVILLGILCIGIYCMAWSVDNYLYTKEVDKLPKPAFTCEIDKPFELKLQNAELIGVVQNNEITLYNYALLKKSAVLGRKYLVSGYALYNPKTKEIIYCDEL